VRFRSMEDRLNPVAPQGLDDSTLGGYPAVHGRAPSFEGSDGSPYSVAVETDPQEDGAWAAYLVFLRWAETGSAIMGHLETGDLARAATAEEAKAILDQLPLPRVKEILEETIAARREETERG
jgi:hypothetical protein